MSAKDYLQLQSNITITNVGNSNIIGQLSPTGFVLTATDRHPPVFTVLTVGSKLGHSI